MPKLFRGRVTRSASKEFNYFKTLSDPSQVTRGPRDLGLSSLYSVSPGESEMMAYVK